MAGGGAKAVFGEFPRFRLQGWKGWVQGFWFGVSVVDYRIRGTALRNESIFQEGAVELVFQEIRWLKGLELTCRGKYMYWTAKRK